MNTRLRILTASTAAVLALATPFVIRWEGKRNRTYHDVAGIPRACMGQTGPRVKIGATYSDATCESWLREELTETYAAVSRCVPVAMSPNQAAAFTAFAYNVGEAGACQSAAARYAGTEYLGLVPITVRKQRSQRRPTSKRLPMKPVIGRFAAIRRRRPGEMTLTSRNRHRMKRGIGKPAPIQARRLG